MKKKLDSSIRAIIDAREQAIKQKRLAEKLENHRDQARREGNGVASERLHPEIRIAHTMHHEHDTRYQQLTNAFHRKLDSLKSSGQHMKGRALCTDMAQEYHRLHTWARQHHNLTKSAVMKEAAHELYLKHREYAHRSIHY